MNAIRNHEERIKELNSTLRKAYALIASGMIIQAKELIRAALEPKKEGE
jgi:hypothetical protein